MLNMISCIRRCMKYRRIGLVGANAKKRLSQGAFERKSTKSLWWCDVMEPDDGKARFHVMLIDHHYRFIPARE